MEKQIKQILKEVYSIDQSLEIHEDKLIKIIQELLRSKPKNKIDDQFIQELRLKVIERVKLLNNIKPQTDMSNSLFKKSFVYSLVGIFLMACVLVFINPSQENDELIISDLGEDAFGKLSFSQQVQDSGLSEIGGSEEMLEGEGLSLSQQVPVNDFLETSVGGEMSTITVSPMIMKNYSFIYTGDDFDLEDGKITVYKTLKGDSLSKALSGIAKDIDLGVLSIGKFQNLKIGNMEISEDREFGYNIFISSRENSLSINSNWERWPNEEFNTPVEMLSGEEILSIANKFLSNYDINMDMYEEGEIVELKNFGLISENVSVVYPLKIDGQIVYDESGQKYGMNVNVNLRHKRVSNVYGLAINTFAGSQYTKETDKDKIINFAKKGGLFNARTYLVENVETVELEIGTPKVSLVKMWIPSSENEMETSEILTPCLIFPVISETSNETYFYRDNIVVPLVGELLEQLDNSIPETRTFE